MTIFYRYIRPSKFNEARLELETLPHGGVCLRFEELTQDNKTSLWFTYARCRNDELFSKEVAKRIADARAATAVNMKHHLLGYYASLPVMKKTDELVAAVIDWCLTAELPADASVTAQYQHEEHRKFGVVLQLLVAQNLRETEKSVIWKSGIAAAGHVAKYEQYANKNR